MPRTGVFHCLPDTKRVCKLQPEIPLHRKCLLHELISCRIYWYYNKMYLFYLGIYVLVSFYCGSVLSQGFNAAIGSTISANITCGSPPAQYFNTKQGYISPRDRVLSLCNASDPRYAHPAANMIDGQLSTFWQSINNKSDAFITINLKQALFGKMITFRFGDYRRPGQIAIFKSSDFGKTYSPWHYQVTSQAECTSVFNIPSNLIFPYPDKINRTVCAEYQTYPLEFDEVITINLNGNERGDGSANFDSPELRDWMKVTNVHIRFTGLFRKFDFIDTRWHHYVVREIDITSVCDCSGHGNGLLCPVNTRTGLRECQCADNTCGTKCDQCCPGFNQYPWRQGSGASWLSDSKTACERCNCFSHSTNCVYNATVDSLGLSINRNGNYSGGGVCLNCLDNTEGINCERCKKFYYRPEGRNRNLTNSCVPCGCFANGTGNQLGYDFLECIRDEISANSHPSKKSGDCFCKQFVTGKTCDQCQNGYYRLEGTNSQGCLPCNCLLAGTLNRNATCNKDFFGQCSCKVNVQLRDCSQCKDGYYFLTDADINGCKVCNCDVGASSSPNCNKISGQCACRSFLFGRTCLSISNGYYYPTLHFIFGSRNAYIAAMHSLITTIHVPRTTFYQIYIVYSMSTAATISLTLRLQKHSFILSSGNLPTTSLNFCHGICFQMFSVAATSFFNLEIGTWNVTVTSSIAESQLKLERVVIIPQLFLTASILSQTNRNWFLANCNVTNNDMRLGSIDEQRCLSYVYSLTTSFNNGALPCNCHVIGSVNMTCQQYGGQCHCKSGVGERDCSRCLPGFYNFSSSGCTPCGCKGPNKICNPMTGMCQCPNNTVGRTCEPCACNNNSNQCVRNGDCINCGNNSTSTRCEVCRLGFYGNAIRQSCKPCNCHVHGSLNQTCDTITGQCYCKPGVIGLKCDKCLPNYYGLITTGCFPCNCNMLGSTSQQCASNGQCSCVLNATGRRCHLCNLGFYGLPTKTCLPCNCDPTGTISGTFCNRDSTGQCQCKTGVTGRTCNQCKKQYVIFSSTGCTQCSLCTTQMQTTVDNLKTQLSIAQTRVNETKNMTLLQAEIVKMQNTVNNLQIASVLYNQRITKGQSDLQYLTNTYLIPLNQRLSALLSTNSRVSQKATSLVSMATSNAARMKALQTSALSASVLTQTATSTTTSVFMSLASTTSLSEALVSKAFTDIQRISLAFHQSMLKSIDADLALSNSVNTNVSTFGQTVQTQQTFSASLTSSVQSSSATFIQWNSTWRQQLPQFLLNIQNVYKRGLDLLTILNSTRSLVLQQQQYISDTTTTQTNVQTILQEATLVYKQGLAAYEQSKIHTTSVTGTLQVSILQFLANSLTIKVLKGQALAARDFPTLTSDPYFLVSLRPDWNNVGTKQSPVINSTLNPNWPIVDSYIFSITREQLQQTSLVITLYDKDLEDADDFMGEVFITLASIPGILTGTVTQTYQIRPQGYDLVSTGFFTSNQNSILDVQKLLTSQIETVDSLMTRAETTATQSEAAANALQNQANLLTSTFAAAKSHASAAVTAVNTYKEIYRLINSSIEAANMANKSASEMMKLMQSLSLSKLQTQADVAVAQSQLLLTAAKARNVTHPSIRFYLRSETLGSVGISSPPRSKIEIDGVDYNKNLDGYNIAIVDIRTGIVESSSNFRIDIDPNAGRQLVDFLDRVQGQKIVALVKQGQGIISFNYQALLMGQLISLGAVPPIITASKGSYALLGYKRTAQETVTWVKQVGKNEGQGISEISETVPLSGSLEDLVNAANTTFQNAWPQWREISTQFATLRTTTERFLLTESIATIVQSSLQAANLILRQATESASKVLRETIQLNTMISDITFKFNQIVFLVGNASSMISNASATATLAETRLPQQFNALNTAKTTHAQMNATSRVIDGRISTMEGKLAQLKSLSMTLPFAIQFLTSDSVVYQLQGYTISTSKVLYNSIAFDMKTNATNGVVLYVLSQPGKMRHSIGVYLQNEYLYLIYHLGFGQTAIRNSMRIITNQWYSVYIARQGKRGILSIRDINANTITAQGESIYSADSNTMDFSSSSSRIYLAGFSPGFMTSLVTLYGQYNGVIDNLVINNIKYNVWSYISYSGNPFYAMTRNDFRAVVTGNWISLFGNGFLRHSIGNFQIQSASSEIQLDFRSLKDNTVILGVTDSTGGLVYGLYLVGGKLLFQFSTGVGQNSALITNRNAYIDGRWYRVNMVRTSINATLSASLIGSTNPLHKETIHVFARTTLPRGVQILFGAPPTSNSAGLPASGIFAGDLRNFYLTNILTSQLKLRNFNSSLYKLSESGISYYGMFDGQAVKGARFYGHMWWIGFGSYSSLIPGPTTIIKSISFVFKTNQLTGIIMYNNENNQYLKNQGILVYFYMALFGGNLVVTFHDSNFATLAPFLSQNLTLSDGRWHNISLNYHASSFNYQLFVDGRSIHTGWFGNFKREIAASTPIYFGGIPTTINIPFAVPTLLSLAMDVKNFIINNRVQNFHQSISFGVSYAGVKPSLFAPQPTGPTPTCGAGFPAFFTSTDVNQVGFGQFPWTGSQSYIGYELSQAQRQFFRSSFVVTLDFKSTSKDGIIFYAADNSTIPTQYVSLELINGRLEFKFSLGDKSLKISTTNDYADGNWHLIHMLRINTFGAILLPTSKEYQSSIITYASTEMLINTPVYIGGLPSSVNASSFNNRRFAFNGCLRRFEVASSFQFFSLNLAAPQIGGSNTGTASCPVNVEPGTFFNGSGWIYYANDFEMGENFTIGMNFKTNKRSGLLFYLFTNDTSQGADSNSTAAKYFVVELKEGKIEMHYKPTLNEPSQTFSWTDPNSNSSYLLCDQQWHNLQIKKNGNLVSITADSYVTNVQTKQSGSIAGNLYIGGIPGEILKPGGAARHFDGCLKSFFFNTRRSIFGARFGQNVKIGCPK